MLLLLALMWLKLGKANDREGSLVVITAEEFFRDSPARFFDWFEKLQDEIVTVDWPTYKQGDQCKCCGLMLILDTNINKTARKVWSRPEDLHLAIGPSTTRAGSQGTVQFVHQITVETDYYVHAEDKQHGGGINWLCQKTTICERQTRRATLHVTVTGELDFVRIADKLDLYTEATTSVADDFVVCATNSEAHRWARILYGESLDKLIKEKVRNSLNTFYHMYTAPSEVRLSDAVLLRAYVVNAQFIPGDSIALHYDMELVTSNKVFPISDKVSFNMQWRDPSSKLIELVKVIVSSQLFTIAFQILEENGLLSGIQTFTIKDAKMEFLPVMTGPVLGIPRDGIAQLSVAGGEFLVLCGRKNEVLTPEPPTSAKSECEVGQVGNALLRLNFSALQFNATIEVVEPLGFALRLTEINVKGAKVHLLSPRFPIDDSMLVQMLEWAFHEYLVQVNKFFAGFAFRLPAFAVPFPNPKIELRASTRDIAVSWSCACQSDNQWPQCYQIAACRAPTAAEPTRIPTIQPTQPPSPLPITDDYDYEIPFDSLYPVVPEHVQALIFSNHPNCSLAKVGASVMQEILTNSNGTCVQSSSGGWFAIQIDDSVSVRYGCAEGCQACRWTGVVTRGQPTCVPLSGETSVLFVVATRLDPCGVKPDPVPASVGILVTDRSWTNMGKLQDTSCHPCGAKLFCKYVYRPNGVPVLTGTAFESSDCTSNPTSFSYPLAQRKLNESVVIRMDVFLRGCHSTTAPTTAPQVSPTPSPTPAQSANLELWIALGLLVFVVLLSVCVCMKFKTFLATFFGDRYRSLTQLCSRGAEEATKKRQYALGSLILGEAACLLAWYGCMLHPFAEFVQEFFTTFLDENLPGETINDWDRTSPVAFAESSDAIGRVWFRVILASAVVPMLLVATDCPRFSASVRVALLWAFSAQVACFAVFYAPFLSSANLGHLFGYQFSPDTLRKAPFMGFMNDGLNYAFFLFVDIRITSALLSILMGIGSGVLITFLLFVTFRSYAPVGDDTLLHGNQDTKDPHVRNLVIPLLLFALLWPHVQFLPVVTLYHQEGTSAGFLVCAITLCATLMCTVPLMRVLENRPSCSHAIAMSSGLLFALISTASGIIMAYFLPLPGRISASFFFSSMGICVCFLCLLDLLWISSDRLSGRTDVPAGQSDDAEVTGQSDDQESPLGPAEGKTTQPNIAVPVRPEIWHWTSIVFTLLSATILTLLVFYELDLIGAGIGVILGLIFLSICVREFQRRVVPLCLRWCATRHIGSALSCLLEEGGKHGLPYRRPFLLVGLLTFLVIVVDAWTKTKAGSERALVEFLQPFGDFSQATACSVFEKVYQITDEYFEYSTIAQTIAWVFLAVSVALDCLSPNPKLLNGHEKVVAEQKEAGLYFLSQVFSLLSCVIILAAIGIPAVPNYVQQAGITEFFPRCADKFNDALDKYANFLMGMLTSVYYSIKLGGTVAVLPFALMRVAAFLVGDDCALVNPELFLTTTFFAIAYAAPLLTLPVFVRYYVAMGTRTTLAIYLAWMILPALIAFAATQSNFPRSKVVWWFLFLGLLLLLVFYEAMHHTSLYNLVSQVDFLVFCSLVSEIALTTVFISDIVVLALHKKMRSSPQEAGEQELPEREKG